MAILSQQETPEEYRERLKRFVAENPGATAEDLELVPMAQSAADIYARYNGKRKAK